MPRRALTIAGLCLACLFFSAALAGTLAGQWVAVPAILCVAFAIWTGVELWQWKRAQRYDLGALRELHDAGGPPEPDEVEIPDDADILCPHCGTLYGAFLPVCPNCRQSPHLIF